MFVISVVVINLISFFGFWLIHKFKAGLKTKGFDRRKWIKRIKNEWFLDNQINRISSKLIKQKTDKINSTNTDVTDDSRPSS